MVLKVIMLVVFFAIMLGVGFYSRKHTKDVNGFVLGGRSVGPWLTAFAYGTSYFSAVIFIGYAGQFGWKYGIASTWIGIGNALLGSLVAWVVLGRRTRLLTQELDTRTMPEFFEKRYSSKSLKLFSSVIIFIFLIPYTASLYNGLSRLFGMAFNVDYKICVIVMAALTGIYVIVGGYMATAINDFIQGLIMLVGIVAVIYAVLNNYGGLTGALDRCEWICSWRQKRWPMAHGICLWNILFFGGHIHRICWTVWMEVWNCIHMDRNWKRAARFAGGMGSSWKTYKASHTGT